MIFPQVSTTLPTAPSTLKPNNGSPEQSQGEQQRRFPTKTASIRFLGLVVLIHTLHEFFAFTGNTLPVTTPRTTNKRKNSLPKNTTMKNKPQNKTVPQELQDVSPVTAPNTTKKRKNLLPNTTMKNIPQNKTVPTELQDVSPVTAPSATNRRKSSLLNTTMKSIPQNKTLPPQLQDSYSLSFLPSSSSNDSVITNGTLIQRKICAAISKTKTTAKSTAPHTLGAFIHVGKTGGSTLSSQLRNACHSWVKKPCPGTNKLVHLETESHLSRFTTYYHTPDFNKLQRGKLSKERYEFHVWTLRDPLSRLLSDFTYEHPRNQRFTKDKNWKRKARATGLVYACFPSLESFATAIGDDPDDFDYPFEPNIFNTSDCTRLARAIMHNKVSIPVHQFYNLQAIHSIMMPVDKSGSLAILVIRTEHTWDDWTTANQWLGQEGHVATFPKIHARQQNHTILPVTKDISEVGRKRLCRALQDEYKVYFRLLEQAVNLSDEDRKAAYELARSNCPSIL